MITPEPIGSHVSTWGEGPVWHGNRLLYVDIEGHKVLSFDPTTGQETIWNVGQRVGTVVPRASGGLIWAGEHGIYALDETTGESTKLCDPEAHIPTNRFNDGKCDPAGRLWVGSMDMRSPRQPTGALYCLHADHRVESKLSPATVSNGIVWTRDASTMYYIDTPRKCVLAFDFDNATGTISNERTAWDVADQKGVPDGMTIDNEDRLWVTFCHGGAVQCYDPRSKQVLERIEFPTIETTACWFGGADGRDLYVTSGIKADLNEALGGRLFVCRPGAQGAAGTAFAG
jgi:sugar lactone lactonase YvrE